MAGLLLTSVLSRFPATFQSIIQSDRPGPLIGAGTSLEGGQPFPPTLTAPSLGAGESGLDSQAFFSQAPDPASGVFFHYRTGMSAQVGFGISTVYYLVDGEVLQVQFPGSNPVAPVGIDPLASVTNYIIGSDQSSWRTGLIDFGAIGYEELYPGIDLKYKVDNHALKYEFIVRPGADPSSIQMEFVNADSLVVQPGEIRATIGSGCLVDADLVTYQGGEDEIIPLESSFVQQGPNSASFDVGEYDRSKVLVIDPVPNVLRYGTYIGGSGHDYGQAIAVENGYAYVTGYTASNPFNTTAGAYDTTFGTPGSYDAFVTKLNLNGSALVYSTYLGGNGDDRGLGIDVENGYAYVTGAMSSSNFWSVAGSFDTTRNGGTYDAFVTKMSLNGAAPLIYSTLLGGSGDDWGTSIAVESGYAYVAGSTDSPTFNTTAGAFDLVPNGFEDVFVTKLNTGGSILTYSTVLGGADFECLPPTTTVAIAVENGFAYVAGMTGSNPFNTTAGAYDTSLGGSSDGFITKLNTAGSQLLYSTYLGGSGGDDIRDIAVENGNAYVTGLTSSTDFPTTTGAFDSTWNAGTNDAFVTKLSVDGAALVYSTYIGSTGDDQGQAIGVHDGDAVITGSTASITNFPTTLGSLDSYYQNGEVFVSKFCPDGSALEYSTFLGGNNVECGRGIAVEDRVVYVCGYTTSSQYFPTTAGAFDTGWNGGNDMFVVKLGEDADSDTLPDDWEISYGLPTTMDNRGKDTDLDGLVDELEYQYKTNPIDDDTDGDNMDDYWEYVYFLDPLDSGDASDDLDSDGLVNYLEYIYRTSPNDNDSDNDGLDDYEEVVIYFTDPLAWGDADCDGISDADEVNIYGSDPQKVDSDNDNLSDSYELDIGTNMTQADTDRDGFDDGVEVARGTDPLSQSSYPGSYSPMVLDQHDYVVIGVAAIIGLVALIISLALHANDKKAIKRLEDKLGGNVHALPADRAAKAEPAAAKKKDEPVPDVKQKGKK